MDKAKVKTDSFVRAFGGICKCADVVRVSQKDGNGTGYTVGLVVGKEQANGKVRCRIEPLAQLIKDLSSVEQTGYNAFTRVRPTLEAAAADVRKFHEAHPAIAIGETATAASDIPEREKASKRSAFDRISSIVEKVEGDERRALLKAVCLAFADDMTAAALKAAFDAVDLEREKAAAVAAELAKQAAVA